MNETRYFVLPECFLLYDPLTFWELEGFNMQRKARLPTQQKLPQKEPEFRVNKATTFSLFMGHKEFIPHQRNLTFGSHFYL